MSLFMFLFCYFGGLIVMNVMVPTVVNCEFFWLQAFLRLLRAGLAFEPDSCCVGLFSNPARSPFLAFLVCLSLMRWGCGCGWGCGWVAVAVARVRVG